MAMNMLGMCRSSLNRSLWEFTKKPMIDSCRTRQTLKLQLLCSPMATDPDPTFDSYADGVLSLSWSTPDACPKALDGSEDAPIPGNSRNGGGGFWSFLKFVFWMVVLVLIAYFAIGM